MLPFLRIGPAILPVPGLLLLIGFWMGLDLTEKHAPRFGAKAGQIYRLVLVGLLAGLVGARLGYALQSPDAFLSAPLSLVSLRPQMLNTQSGLLAAALAAFIYGQRTKMDLWPTLDALTSLFAVIMITLGLANFASGSGFGAPTQVPWAINLWGAQRQPTQIYEILAALTVAIITWPGSLAARPNQPAGLRFWLFCALTALTVIFLQGLRGDSVLLAGLRAAQIMAWLLLAISLWQVGRRMTYGEKSS